VLFGIAALALSAAMLLRFLITPQQCTGEVLKSPSGQLEF